MAQLELELQKKVRDAIQEAGGKCRIISHRFVVGVPDLLLKLPGHETMIVEVKQCKFPVRAPIVSLEATVPQKIDLNGWQVAGARSGILSFLVRKKGVRKELFAAFLPTPEGGFDLKSDPTLAVSSHFPIDVKCRDVVGLLSKYS